MAPYTTTQIDSSTPATGAAGQTLVDVLKRRASDHGHDIALSFVGNLEKPDLTFEELANDAECIARALRCRITPRQRVILMLEPGPGFPRSLFGCFFAGAIAVPAALPDPRRLARTLPRLRAILEDAHPALIVTTESFRSAAADFATQKIPPMVTVDELLEAGREAPSYTGHPKPESLAFLQYTSGSTASPKGVMITHVSIMRELECLRGGWDYRERETRALMWVPDFHDDGLVHGNLLPVYLGYRCWRMAPSDLVRAPRKWLEVISKNRITHSGGPNFAFALALRQKDADFADLDLSSWRMAYNAAEPIRYAVVEEFIRRLEPAGFQAKALTPSYGLAEATLLVSAAEVDKPFRSLQVDPEVLEKSGRALIQPEGRTIVSCGVAAPGVELKIVDANSLEVLPDLRVGEILVGSNCLAEGYWMRPIESEETFIELEGPGRRFLRTGDLGFLHRGDLYVTGRLKDLIIIRGRNLYPQDLELTAESADPAVRAGCVAAFSVDSPDDGEGVALIAEVQSADSPGVAQRIFESIVEFHDVAPQSVTLIPKRSLPKTSSGKIQRHACRRALDEGALEILSSYRPGQKTVQNAAPAPKDQTETDGRSARAESLIEWLRVWGPNLDLRQMDEARALGPQVLLDLGSRGFFALRLTEQQGGLGLSDREAVEVYRQLGSLDLGLTTLVLGQNALGSEVLASHAHPEVRESVLPEIARGRVLTCFALSEEASASDPRGMMSRARPDGLGGWTLDAEKRWVGSAGWAHNVVIFVRTESGVSAFSVDRHRAGVEIGPEIPTFGVRSISQASVRLSQVPVRPADLLGEVGDGIGIAEQAFVRGRLGLAAASAGLISRALVMAGRFAAGREISTGSLLEHPVAQTRLLEMEASVTALDALCREIADRLEDSWEEAVDAAAAAKNAGARLAGEAADSLMQTYAARGYLESSEVPRLYRDARLLRIYEGTTETLAAYLGSRLENRPEAIERWLIPGSTAESLSEGQRILSSAALELEASRPQRKQWLQQHLGELFQWALLRSSTERATAPGPGEAAALARAGSWAQRRFEQTLHSALAEAKNGSRVSFDELKQTIDSHAARLGPPASDVGTSPAIPKLREMTESPSPLGAEAGASSRRPGRDRNPIEVSADRAPAPAFKASTSESPETAPSQPTSAQEASLNSSASPSVLEYRSWIAKWLAEEAGVRPEEIDFDQRFAAYGIDSVTGVLLADHLGQQIDKELDADLLWRFPTPAALAEALS
ncbi:MAG: AMP-binding protein [Acidobacteriota bacterium]